MLGNIQKSLSVCIIGKPNAGKSTLLNYIIGEKISIVTPKIQTTRSIITGVITFDNTQIVLFDTPGIFEPKKKLEKAMVRCAWSSLNSADIITLIIDATKKIDSTLISIINRILTDSQKKLVFILNKIDLKSKHTIENIGFLQKISTKSRIFRISALKGRNVKEFLEYLKENANNSSWGYEADDITNLPLRFLAAEITREQLFLKLQQELPYNLTVEAETWEKMNDGSVKINQVIIVSRDSYKNIIIGKKGSKIKEIGLESRVNIEKLIDCRVHLFLFVKVRKNWEDNIESIL